MTNPTKSVCIAMSIFTLSAVAAEKEFVFPAADLKTGDKSVTLTTDAKGRVVLKSPEKTFRLYSKERFPVQGLGAVRLSGIVEGKGNAGLCVVVYNEKGRYITVASVPKSGAVGPRKVEGVVRFQKKHGKSIPAYAAVGYYVNAGAEAAFSDCKAVYMGQTGNPALIPTTRTDWAAGMYKSLTKSAREKKSVPVMFLGDSITMLWEYSSQNQYPGGLDSWNRYFKDMGAVNFGVSGDSVENVLWRVTEGDNLACNPRAIVLLIGTNNLHQQPYATEQEIAEGIDNLLKTIKEKVPDAKILLLGIFPRRGTNRIPQIAGINAELEKIARKHGVEFRDYTALLLKGKKEVSKEIFRDGLHLSPAGYELLAKALLPDVKRLSGK